MKTALAVAALAVTIASLGGCANQRGTQPNTEPLSSTPVGAQRLTTQLKGADGSQVADATFDFANGYATVTVEAGPNRILTPGFHGLQIHSVGRCEPNSVAPTGGSAGDFDSAGAVYQAPGHTGYPASGDLTALQVRADGSAKLVTTSNAFTAEDLRNSSGTALVVHQDADNLAAPTNVSGKRVACGVIAAASATTTSSTTATTTVTTSTTTTAVPPPSTSISTSTVTVTSSPGVPTTPSKTVTTNSLPPGGG